jgi:hypothetical protein
MSTPLSGYPFKFALLSAGSGSVPINQTAVCEFRTCNDMWVSQWCRSVTPLPRFTPGERTHITHCTGRWVGLRAGLNTEAIWKIPCFCWGSNSDLVCTHPVASSHTQTWTLLQQCPAAPSVRFAQPHGSQIATHLTRLKPEQRLQSRPLCVLQIWVITGEPSRINLWTETNSLSHR